MSVGDPDCEQD